MFRKTFLRAFFILAIATASLLVFAGRKINKPVQEDTCTESQSPCDKPKAQGEFMILEALNRAVMATTR